MSFWLIQNYHDTADFLSVPERAFIIRRLKRDNQTSAAGEKFAGSALKQSVKDWKMYLFALLYAGSDAPLYAFSLFTPSIIKVRTACPLLRGRASLIA
jgi:hypothetical protein